MKKIVVDILLFILMLMEFSRIYLPPEIHEIIGILFVVLVIIHLLLHIKYIKSIPRGKYNHKRKAMLIINVAFMAIFTLTCVLGMLSSQYTLTFMNIGNLTTIYLHKIFAYLGLILLGLHLGINLNLMFNKLGKRKISYALYLIIIICGIYSFFKVDFLNHLLGNSGFSLVTGNLIVNSLEYLSIILMISIFSNILFKKLA
ncbi:hypothetical protein [Methanobrevibacter sp.]|uniref:hypothetical protein n=1 Tax=Methanobrevibacter sp. TaxID=66852 RepID=UPI0038689C67